jgi:hypothetical protein
MRDEVSYPYNGTDKITFLIADDKTNGSEVNGRKRSSNSVSF